MRGRFQPASLHVIAVLIGALVVACSNDEPAPSRLMDGSRAPALPIELEGLSAPPVLTGVRIVPVRGIESAPKSASCVQQRWAGTEPAGRIVERTGISSETVTFRDRSGRGLYSCDSSTGPRADDRAWCGASFGRLYSGHLRDPRLDLVCTTLDEDPVGFVWIEPSQSARYVAVQQPGYAEVYRVVGDVPVRVSTTSGVEIEGSRATFDLSEHDADGRLLRRRRLEAAVAG